MSEQPVASIAANVAAAARTAHEVLQHLETSLRRAGFADGLPAYQKMAETLAGQRMWIQAAAPSAEVDRMYGAVAERARTLYGILEPYAKIMKALGALEAVASSEAAPAPVVSCDPLIDALRAGEKSLTVLRSELQVSRRDLERRLRILESERRVESRLARGRRLYRLA